MNATHKGREFAELALKSEQAKAENGLTTSFVLLEFQRLLTAARLAEIRALVEYNKALVELALQEGTTLDKNAITLNFK